MKIAATEYNRLSRIIEANNVNEAMEVLQKTDHRYKKYLKRGNMLYNPNKQSMQVWFWEYKTLAQLEGEK